MIVLQRAVPAHVGVDSGCRYMPPLVPTSAGWLRTGLDQALELIASLGTRASLEVRQR